MSPSQCSSTASPAARCESRSLHHRVGDCGQSLLPPGRARARAQGPAQCQREHMGDKRELSQVIRGNATLPEERAVGKIGSKRKKREGIRQTERPG